MANEKQENELAHDAFLNSLKATHDRAVHDLRKEFARKGTEVQKQYEAKTKAVREQLEEERKQREEAHSNMNAAGEALDELRFLREDHKLLREENARLRLRMEELGDEPDSD